MPLNVIFRGGTLTILTPWIETPDPPKKDTPKMASEQIYLQYIQYISDFHPSSTQLPSREVNPTVNPTVAPEKVNPNVATVSRGLATLGDLTLVDLE